MLIILLLLLSRCGNDDPPASSGATSAPTAASPSAVAVPPAGGTASGSAPAAQPGTSASAQQATVIAGGDTVLGAGATADLSGHDGEQATGHAVRVQSVPADEGFWVGSSATERVWLQLTGTRGESDYRVKQGDAIDFTGTVSPAAKGFADKVGVTAAEGADQLTQQGHYISVPSSSVKLFG